MSEKKLNAENSRFSVGKPVSFAAEIGGSEVGGGQPKKRTFSGIAYSGDVIKDHWYWGSVIFDLSTMTVPSRLPALVDHDRSKRAGYVTSSSVDNATGFAVTGVLLSGESGAGVARDSDEGFPWQMSVHIEPQSIEEFAVGTQTIVNGRVLAGPLTVFRNSTIVEVSFTATGQDANTTAVAMSRGSSNQQPTPTTEDQTMPMTTAEQIAAMQQENAALKAANGALTKERDAARSELDKFSKDRRDADIKKLFADINREITIDDKTVQDFANMTQAAFDSVAAVMREQFKKTNQQQGVLQQLFGHVAINGGTPTQRPDDANDPLLANAKDRAVQYAKAKRF